MNDLPDTFEQFAARLGSLEQRVAALEHPQQVSASSAVEQPALFGARQSIEPAPFAQSGSLFSVVGRAMLGIAGAYVLRAVAETGALPKLAVAVVAIAYAVLWLIGAARVKAGEWLAATIYACTSAMILGPMLWELTLRFNVLPPALTAVILAGYVFTAAGLGWKRNLAPLFWISNITVAFAALALSVATHDLLPFIATLLVMALIAEIAAVLHHAASTRLLAAAAADLAAWALIFIYASAPETRTEYRVLGAGYLIAPGCLLFLLYLVSVAIRTIVQKRKISVFETAQTLIAFLLAAASLLYFAPHAGAAVLATACLILSAATYSALFVFLGPSAEPRTLRVFSAWSLGLVLAGSWLLLPTLWLAAFLAAAALLATLLGTLFRSVALQFHGQVYLVAAVLAAGLPAYVFSVLAGALPAAPTLSVYLGTVCAILCYASLRPSQLEHSMQRLFPLLPAVLGVCALAALTVQALAMLGLTGDAFHLAFFRTLTLSVVALGLAFAGSHWVRIELTWLAYTTLAFVAAKLLFEDLRHGHLAFIAASIFVFAVTLIAVPRLARWGEKLEGAGR